MVKACPTCSALWAEYHAALKAKRAAPDSVAAGEASGKVEAALKLIRMHEATRHRTEPSAIKPQSR
jgi:hypothetical protein